MWRFLETFVQFSFLAILLRQKRTLLSPTGLLPGSHFPSQPSCPVSLGSDFRRGNDFCTFFTCIRKEKKRGKIRALIKWHKSVSGVTCGVLWWFSLWMTPFGTNRNRLLVGQHLQSLTLTVLRILMPPATYGTGRGGRLEGHFCALRLSSHSPFD